MANEAAGVVAEDSKIVPTAESGKEDCEGRKEDFGGQGGCPSAPNTGDGDEKHCAGEDGGNMRYASSNVVLVECEHIREMVGETDECLRRTRSVAAENAVLNVVRDGGVEPDWFVEWWLDDEKKLVAAAVFEDACKAYDFCVAVGKKADELKERDGKSPIELRSDLDLSLKTARYFSDEWEKRHKEQAGKYRTVLEDAAKSGEWFGRVIVGSVGVNGKLDDANAVKAAFDGICAELNALYPHDENGGGGIAYTGYFDGKVARFAFGFQGAAACDVAFWKFMAIGARVVEPISGGAVAGGIDDIDVEMAALVIAKMQSDAKNIEIAEK